MHVRISGAKSLTERRWLAERDDFGAHLPIGIATRGRIRIDGTRTGLPPCSHRAACGTAVDPHDKHSPRPASRGGTLGATGADATSAIQ